MRVAVITLHRVYNYGSVLQAYATQRILEQMGHSVQIIDYISPQRTLKRIFLRPGADKSLPGVKSFTYRIAKIGSLLLKEKTFGRFVKNYLHLTKKYITADDLTADPPMADIYVTGSDQTWNSTYNEGIDRGFFLDFIPETARRISFVASFGKDKLDEWEKELTKQYLSRYEGLSVRESSAVEIIDKLGLKTPMQLIDPTLQIEKDEWLILASKRLVKDPYLILMLLYSEDNGATEYARRIADEKGLKLVKISWEMKRPKKVDKLFTHRSPEVFLSLFYHADFVVTNSFHGLAFSIIFEKQFIVIPRNEYNTRIVSLLQLLNLQKRLVESEDGIHICKEVIDYGPVNEILQIERKKARCFIKSYIN